MSDNKTNLELARECGAIITPSYELDGRVEPEDATLTPTQLDDFTERITNDKDAEIAALREGAPYGIIDPDYARVYSQARIVAWQFGFALVMHGSFTRDLDLLLVPWEGRACDAMAPTVVERIARACGLTVNGAPRDKAHGRKAYTLLFPGTHDPRWVDLSVIPAVQP